MPLEKLAYVVPHGLLAGSKFPSSDNSDDSALVEMTAIRKFKTLISLTETSHPDAKKLEAQYGLKQAIHLPISDFSTPTDAQIRRFVQILLERSDEAEGKQYASAFVNCPILIHCHLGAGRTGLMLSIGIVAFYYFWRFSFRQEQVEKDPEIASFVQEIGSVGDTKNLFTNVISYHRRVRPQSIMTTKQVRFLEKILLHDDEEQRRSLFLTELKAETREKSDEASCKL